ncbi:hypothetical protein MA04_01271 [Alcanivorax balearicus MACL04]|uniref:Uncharacterized protein n=1 Tax=Alloalcanivorax balearicus MACL04 TaxID=1177182 RepID=A0ABT2QWS3_9GAMM|nr:hypothetical protein [Alloalcanivorax balearicus]MCU5781971.1 hypothetical protein [Alloalcanivorax balearicus MACL04]
MAGALVLAVMSAVSTTAQAQPPSPWPTRLSVAAIAATHPDLETTFRFPWITGSSCGPTARCNIGWIAWRINAWLQASALGQLPVDGRTAFERVWTSSGKPHGFTSLDFTVLAHTRAFLSLTVHGTQLNGYPSSFSHAYSFDTATGHPLSLQDLFTKQGLASLNQDVRRQWRPRLEAALKNETGASRDSDEMQSRQEYYTQCLEALLNDQTVADTMILEAAQLTLTRDCPFPRVAQALNDLGRLSARYSRDALQPWLNDYGRCLFERKSLSSCSLPRGRHPHPGIYRARADHGDLVTLVLGRSSDVDQSFYAESQAGPLHPLETTQDKSLKLTRPDGKAQFLLEVDQQGNLEGIWRRADVTFPVHFSY